VLLRIRLAIYLIFPRLIFDNLKFLLLANSSVEVVFEVAVGGNSNHFWKNGFVGQQKENVQNHAGYGQPFKIKIQSADFDYKVPQKLVTPLFNIHII